MNVRTRKLISAGIWAIAAIACVILWMRYQQQTLQLKGVVQATVHRISAPETTRIETILVQPGEVITKGQPLVQLESSDLQAELAVARGRLLEMSAAMEAESQTHLRELTQKRLDLKSRQAEAIARYSNAKAVTASQRAELKALDAQLERLAAAEQAGVAALDSLSSMRSRQARLTKVSRISPETIAGYRNLTDTLTRSLERLNEDQSSVRLGPFRARAKTQGKLVNGLLSRIERRTVKAPANGQITRINAAAGDVVTPGTPVLEMVGQHSSVVIAYIPETHARRFKVDQALRVNPRDSDNDEDPLDGRVMNVGASIVQLPERLWRRPNVAEFGRAVHIDLGSSHLLPGEVVFATRTAGQASAHRPLEQAQKDTDVTRASNTQLDTAVPRSSVRGEVNPRPVKVPPKLQTLTRMEISGALSMPDIEDILVISDDTGQPGQDEDKPWVFWMNPRGELLPDPTEIRGIDRISDLESVTMDDRGQLYFLCSQSRSRRGKRPKKRQYLVRAQREGRELTVTGTATLYRLLKAKLSPDKMAELGIDETLDIEGMTWWRNGLLLGLKSPLTQGHKARLLHLSNLNVVFGGATDASDALSLSHVADLALPTGPNQEPGGISELFAEANTLYLLSTVPDGPEAGASWRYNLKTPDTAPQKLATWSGLKPEGMARVSDETMLVFFDRGAKPPLMTSLITQQK